MYEVDIKDNIITVYFQEFEDLFKHSEAFYNKGLNVFPYFLHKEQILNTPYSGHYHEGIEEKRPHLHIAQLNGDELQILAGLLDI